MKIDQASAVERALALKLHSALDAAFIAVAEQLNAGKPVTLDEAVRLLNNDQILDYAAFLYQSRSQQELDMGCKEHPPSAASEREWLLNEKEICLARSIADVAAHLETRQEMKTGPAQE
ncbi:hypothetical protein HFU84_13910 [Acidithiobacillus sp. CV18-2]|uniref:Uncharacterized protein n=1 Tax=Igneacidithiobacillus copahuensis TaxID=2724909 RepID=A0AAE2YNW5_9PROT|nr:hypothetical protein [Igneacidithiobacillus copahuensis]MBU2754199.1 hypothetical protein [Acidithiobacillus sp. CV18-3]MBU2757699.1 hypothetical protein [Acidithiobacillus sp. BN09-2]MBU2778567.1 hypothetical protein [Acidithiobacillus sp. CV18-2]MBU2797092.1 hypothetical protein [Acidithiobacillus sp. VAN18-2]MBU2799069.1 hypothetical protein [Acidithiobacillus sp. VAN18-4]